jgi:hypothetical protein
VRSDLLHARYGEAAAPGSDDALIPRRRGPPNPGRDPPRRGLGKRGREIRLLGASI